MLVFWKRRDNNCKELKGTRGSTVQFFSAVMLYISWKNNSIIPYVFYTFLLIKKRLNIRIWYRNKWFCIYTLNLKISIFLGKFQHPISKNSHTNRRPCVQSCVAHVRDQVNLKKGSGVPKVKFFQVRIGLISQTFSSKNHVLIGLVFGRTKILNFQEWYEYAVFSISAAYFDFCGWQLWRIFFTQASKLPGNKNRSSTGSCWKLQWFLLCFFVYF